MTKEIAKKGMFIGAGVGLVLFALVGLLPGSFIGGMIGLNMAGSIFGTPLNSSLLPRIIVGASMVLGVMISCIVFVTGASILGWLIGHTVDVVRHGRAVRQEAALKSK